MRAFIAIESCTAHADRVKAQLETWANSMMIEVQVFDGPRLGVPDDYRSLPAKTQAICKWAKNNDYDHLFKVDTDTFVSTTRLVTSRFHEHEYTGYVLDWSPPNYCSGPHYWLGPKAIDILAEADWSSYCGHPELRTLEDLMVGRVLAAHGIFPHHDPRYAPFAPVLPNNNVISQHLSSREPYKIEMMFAAHRQAMGLP